MNFIFVIDILWLWFLFLDQSCNVDGKIVIQILSGYLFWDHNQSKESQAWTAWNVLDKIIPNVYNKLIGRECFSELWISLHGGFNFLVDFMKSLHFVLELLAFLWFLCLCKLTDEFYCFSTVVIQLWRSRLRHGLFHSV